jgi:hypothetical protein
MILCSWRRNSGEIALAFVERVHRKSEAGDSVQVAARFVAIDSPRRTRHQLQSLPQN